MKMKSMMNPVMRIKQSRRGKWSSLSTLFAVNRNGLQPIYFVNTLLKKIGVLKYMSEVVISRRGGAGGNPNAGKNLTLQTSMYTINTLFTVPESVDGNFMVRIFGGGGGGCYGRNSDGNFGAGGGGGWMNNGTLKLSKGSQIQIIIGSGGNKLGRVKSNSTADSGGTSSFGSYLSAFGGRGGSTIFDYSAIHTIGGYGGSGGGGAVGGDGYQFGGGGGYQEDGGNGGAWGGGGGGGDMYSTGGSGGTYGGGGGGNINFGSSGWYSNTNTIGWTNVITHFMNNSYARGSGSNGIGEYHALGGIGGYGGRGGDGKQQTGGGGGGGYGGDGGYCSGGGGGLGGDGGAFSGGGGGYFSSGAGGDTNCGGGGGSYGSGSLTSTATYGGGGGYDGNGGSGICFVQWYQYV